MGRATRSPRGRARDGKRQSHKGGRLDSTYRSPCIRDYIHVVDLAAAHLLALEHLVAGESSAAFNLGTGEGHSVREVFDVCQKVSGTEIPVTEGPRRPGDPPRLVADPSRARDELRWKAGHPLLEEIVETAWAWMTRQHERA